ncbi:MAG: 4'-phosphopantetheinyl transferase family protein [Longimicrobiales bacterium]
MNPIWHLGNDVVDLRHHGGGTWARDPRFVARVCSPEEEEALCASPDPNIALWVHWAGKEAIYKSTSKALGAAPVFRHPRFRVSFSEEGLQSFIEPLPDAGSALVAGSGSYEDIRFRLLVERTEFSVHAVSWIHRTGGGTPDYQSRCQEWQDETRGSAAGLEEHFSALEWECITHRASALTRIRVRRDLAEALGVSEDLLEIRCGPGSPGRRIPTVWLDGNPLAVDLSLSHHNRFLAWAFLSPVGPGKKGADSG